jgi:hypothetical protein
MPVPKKLIRLPEILSREEVARLAALLVVAVHTAEYAPFTTPPLRCLARIAANLDRPIPVA